MEPVDTTLHAGDGVILHVADWPLPADAKAAGTVVIMHGLGEHCGRYRHVARFFNQLGFAVRTYDHRGHGRSGGARGDVPNQHAILDDARLVIEDFQRNNGGAPPLLLGHSMGGLFAARYATGKLSPLRGVILSSPPLSISLKPVHKLLLKVLGALAPGLGIDNGLKTEFLSHDQNVVSAYRADPLVHPKISARLLTSMLAAADYANANVAALSVPVLLVYAGSDRIVDARGSAGFAAALPPAHGTVHRYDDFYHEIFNETGAERVFADVRRWLQKSWPDPALAPRSDSHAAAQ